MIESAEKCCSTQTLTECIWYDPTLIFLLVLVPSFVRKDLDDNENLGFSVSSQPPPAPGLEKKQQSSLNNNKKQSTII
jgi:hypothetical protein